MEKYLIDFAGLVHQQQAPVRSDVPRAEASRRQVGLVHTATSDYWGVEGNKCEGRPQVVR
jgi:hypothetical protein